MKGILFTPDNIKAIMEGRKTQTRRLVKFHKAINPRSSLSVNGGIFSSGDTQKELELLNKGLIKPDISLSRYLPGETVYVKEAVKIMDFLDHKGVVAYKTTANPDHETKSIKWTSPLFMPEWAARIFLKIISAEPQRLQDITGLDCEAEGIKDPSKIGEQIKTSTVWDDYMKKQYQILWDSINPKHPWSHNDWVWKYAFAKVGKP